MSFPVMMFLHLSLLSAIIAAPLVAAPRLPGGEPNIAVGDISSCPGYDTYCREPRFELLISIHFKASEIPVPLSTAS